MKTSQVGVDFIATWEAFRPTVYPDVAGIPTIGFGHVVKAGDPTEVTRETALAILGHDVAAAESAVNADVKTAVSQEEFDALVSFTFNCGTGALMSSSLLTFLNNGDDAVSVAKEFLKWVHARVGGRLVVSEGLRNRRLAEAAMFLGVSVDEAKAKLGLTAPTVPPPPLPVSPVLPDEGQPTLPEDLDDG